MSTLLFITQLWYSPKFVCSQKDHSELGAEADEESTLRTYLASPDASLPGYKNSNPQKKYTYPFKCSFCCKTFLKKASLENHVKTHKTVICQECQKPFTSARALHRHKQCVHSNKEKPFNCEICDKAFTAIRYLRSHSMIHTMEMSASCEQCGKFFKHKSSLRKHAVIHQVIKPFNCSICKRSFSQKQHLNDHLRIHSEDKPFSCDECGKSFKQKQALHSHKQTHLGLSLNCSICNKSFKKRSNLISHMVVHTKVNKCRFCEKTFNCKPELFKHEENVHLGMEYKKLTCSLCSLEFTSQELLNEHFSSSHPDAVQTSQDGETTNLTSNNSFKTSRQMKTFTCSICRKRYKRRSTLLAHLQDHSWDGKLFCKKCKTIFTSKADLNSHVCGTFYAKHYECTECGKVFSSYCTLRKHKLVHSGLKPYSCECGKRFNQKSNLETHKLTHLSVKPFKCPICSATFAQRANLNYHELTHSGEYPFNCTICNRVFRRKSYLKRHRCNNVELRPLSELVETVLICEETISDQTSLVLDEEGSDS